MILAVDVDYREDRARVAGTFPAKGSVSSRLWVNYNFNRYPWEYVQWICSGRGMVIDMYRALIFPESIKMAGPDATYLGVLSNRKSDTEEKENDDE